MERLQHYFAMIRGPTRADGRHILKGIILLTAMSHGCVRPTEYGWLKALYNRWERSSDMSVFARIMVGLTELATDKKKISNPLIKTVFRLLTSGRYLLQSTSPAFRI